MHDIMKRNRSWRNSMSNVLLKSAVIHYSLIPAINLARNAKDYGNALATLTKSYSFHSC